MNVRRKRPDEIRAPKGKFLVCEWDPSNPEKSVPAEVAGPYTVKGFAIGYAKMMNKKPQTKIGEADYFVVDDRGFRVY